MTIDKAALELQEGHQPYSKPILEKIDISMDNISGKGFSTNEMTDPADTSGGAVPMGVAYGPS